MADFRRQTPAGELQISVAEITEAADPLGPRLETPLVFSIARFPFAKRKSSFPIGEPEVRIHLPPAASPLRTRLPLLGALAPCGAGLPKDWLSNSAVPRLRRDGLLADEGKVQKSDSRNALVEAALVLPELHLFLDIGDV